jgi:transposase
MAASVTDLPDDVLVLKAMVIAGLEREARMQHLLDQLKRATFGRRSEKLSADQLALALEDIEEVPSRTAGACRTVRSSGRIEG